VTIVLTRKRVVGAVAALLLAVAGIALGLGAMLRVKAGANTEARTHSLAMAGDAPVQVQSGVRNALRTFQDGYIQRDPKNLDLFMSRLFLKDSDILIMGTDYSDLAQGYSAAANFIRLDWQNWGDLRFNVDDSTIWSSGDVAWVASTGTVRFPRGERPVRLTAILTRNKDEWQFRQVQFQWDDGDPDEARIPRPGIYLKLFRSALRRAAVNAGLIHP
jgi:hypothetical protein